MAEFDPKPLFRLLDDLRGFGAFEDVPALAAVLMAGVALADAGKMELPDDPRDLVELPHSVFAFLGHRALLESLPPQLYRISLSPGVWARYYRSARDAVATIEHADMNEVASLLLGARSHKGWDVTPKPAISAFISRLVIAKQAETVLLVGRATAEIACHLADQGLEVHLAQEDRSTAWICASLAAVMNWRFRLTVARMPQLLPADGIDASDQSFEAIVVAPPFGAKLENREVGSRASFRGQTYEGIALEYAASAAQIGIVVISNGFLLRTSKNEMFFKEEAIDRLGMNAILGLPPRSFDGTAIQGALAIVDRGAPKGELFMTKLPDALSGATGRSEESGHIVKAALNSAVHTALSRLSTDVARIVSRAEVAANDLNLVPDRYLLSRELARANQHFADLPSAPLEELCELLRTQALPALDAGSSGDDLFHDLREMAASDIDETGLVVTPAKTLRMSDMNFRRSRPPLLQNGDVVIAVKGSAGKIGIVQEIPEGERWITNQSFLILRTRGDLTGLGRQLDPRVLFQFLSSAVGQSLIARYVSGATIPGIAASDLRRISVPILPRKDQDAVAAKVDEVLGFAKIIRTLRTQAADKKRAIWPDADFPVHADSIS